MESMSMTVNRVISFYGYSMVDNDGLVTVSGPHGELSFRRVNNTRYVVRNREVSVAQLIGMIEEL